MKAIWLIGAAVLLASPAAAQRATSAYSPLDPDRCQVLERIVEGESVRWRCPGRYGIDLFLNVGDGRYDLDAGVDNREWESITPFNTPGTTVEWRLHGGRAVAIIYRLIPGQQMEAAPVLVVETIGAHGRPGCTVARVNAQRADANARARAEADLRAGRFRCGRDRIAEIGR